MTEEEIKQATEEEIKQALKEERAKREIACGKELQELLDKYNCRFDVATILRSEQSPIVRIEIVAK